MRLSKVNCREHTLLLQQNGHPLPQSPSREQSLSRQHRVPRQTRLSAHPTGLARAQLACDHLDLLAASRPCSELVITHPRVEESVSDIDQQIHDQQSDRYEGDDTDDQRFIAIE